MEKANGVFINHKFVCTYENYSTDQVLSAVMPSGTEVTTAFETIGHIAHLNLRDHQLEFKEIIGEYWSFLKSFKLCLKSLTLYQYKDKYSIQPCRFGLSSTLSQHYYKFKMAQNEYRITLRIHF